MRDSTPIQELRNVLARYSHEFNEPETITFLANVRERGILRDDEWDNVLRWLNEAMAYLEKDVPIVDKGVVNVNANPRNADWIRIVRARRLAGFGIPGWASPWLWRIGCHREGTAFWEQIGEIAKDMGFRPLEEE